MRSFEEVIRTEICKAEVSVELVLAGVNKNYRCQTSKDDFFVRFSPVELHTLKQLQFEASVLRRAEKHELSLCRAHQEANAVIHGPFEVEGRTYNAFLNETVKGTPLECQTGDVELFARSLATLHSLPIEDLAPPENDLAGVREDLADGSFKSIANEIQSVEKTLSKAKVGKSVILHGDAWIGNALKAGHEAILFDLEHTRIGSPEYDIATFLWALKAEQPHAQNEIFKSFYRGYGRHRDGSFNPDLINRCILEKELRNLHFMQCFINLTPQIKKHVQVYAEETLRFVEDNQTSRLLMDPCA